MRHAIGYVTQDIAVIQDADMEYDPADVPALIAPIVRGVADVVYGSRLGGAPQRAYMFWHLMGNRLLSMLTGVLFNTTLSDMETGYKASRPPARTGRGGSPGSSSAIGAQPERRPRWPAPQPCNLFLGRFLRLRRTGPKPG